MNAIGLKIKADITSRIVVSTLTTITIAVSAMLLTLALATLMNLSAPYDTSFAELNGAHLWLYFDRSKVHSREISRLEALPGIEQSTGLQYSINSRAGLGDARVWVSVRMVGLEPPPVNRLLLQEGQALVPQETQVMASRDLEDLYGLAAGDSVELTRGDGKKVSLPVAGLAYNPTWDTYRNSQPPYLYVTEETMRRLYPADETWDWSIGLRLVDPKSVDEVLDAVEGLLPEDAVVGHTDWRDVRRSAVFGARINFVFLGAFSAFAILATVLVITSSISATVLAQFKQIGLLKAIGFTQRQILHLYVGQYLVLAGIGSPLGLLCGVLLSPLPLKSVAASLSTTFKPPTNILLIALVMLLIPGFVVLATIGAAYRGARANVIKAIAVGAEAPRKKLAWPVRLAERAGLPIVLVLGLNDIFAKPFRSLLTGLNLILGVIGIVFGLALNDTLDTYRQDPSLLGIVYDARLTREQTPDAKTRGLLRRAPGVTAFYAERLLEAETGDGKSFQIRAVEGDLEAFPFRLSQGKFFAPNSNEVTAGQGLLDWLELEVGDNLILYLEGQDRPTTWHIVGQYPEPVNVGQMLMASLTTVQRTLRHLEPSVYYLRLAPNANVSQLRHYLAPRPDSDLNLTLIGQAIPGVVVYLQIAILVLAAILIAIALINVFNSALLAMQERLRVIGVLKTVGMTPAQVLTMICATSGLLGLLAAAVGIPLGLAFTRGVLLSLSRTYGFGQVQISIGWLYLLALPPVMVAVSVLGSSIPGRQAARLNIVDVLRSE